MSGHREDRFRGLRALVLITFLMCAACGGGGGGPARGFPAAAATIPASASAAADVINVMSEAAILIDVVLDASAMATDDVTVTLVDQVGGTISLAGNGLDGGGVLRFGPIDGSVLEDGPIDIVVEVRAAGDTLGQATFGPALKDTIAPAAPPAVTLTDGTGAPLGTINESTEDDVVTMVDHGGGLVPSDTITVCFTDGVNEVCSPPVPVDPGGASTMVPPLDLGPLADGPLGVQVIITDGSGNETLTGFGTVPKDTFVALPLTAFITGAGGAPVNVINDSTEGNVEVEVTLPPDSEASDSLTVTISDGASSSTSAPTAALGGGGTLLVGGLDAAPLVDGAITVTVDVVDDDGNSGRFFGTSGQKDTLVGGATSIAVSAGPGNAAGVINLVSVGAVFLDVDLGSNAATGDVVTLTLTDAMGADVTMTAAAASGPVTMIYGPIDASPLADGPISLSAAVADPSGNRSAPVLGTATKNTVAPPAPTSASVPAGPSNPAGVVNSSTDGNARVDIVLAAGTTAGDIVRIVVSGAGGMLTFDRTAPGPGNLAATGLDLSSLGDGALGLDVHVIDAVGNPSATFTGAAVLDRVVATPTSVTVRAGPGHNGGFVSAANETSVTLDLNFPSSSLSSDQLGGQIGVGGFAVALPVSGGVSGGGAVAIAGLDLGVLPDGSGVITGTMTDVAGNTAAFGPFPFTKDTVAPPAPTLLRVAAGTGNTADEINQTSAGAVILDVIWDLAADGTETAVLGLFDGTTTVTFAPVTVPAGGGAATVGPTSAGSLSDGAITVRGDLTDPAGNATTFTGIPATKDTVGPPAPTAAGIRGGMANPADFVNAATQGSVFIDVTLPAGYSGSDTVTATLGDGVSTATSSAVVVPPGGGTLTLGGVDASSLNDGPLSVVVTATDPTGNSTSFTGLPGTKDTIAPLAPASASVAAGPSNAAGIINVSSEIAVVVDVVWDPSMVGDESAAIRFTDITMMTATLGPLSPPSGGGARAEGSIDLSALSDGAISIDVDVTDPAGNTSTFSGTAATKNTVGPALPLAAGVDPGAGNNADVINVSSVNAVDVTVMLGAGSISADSVQVFLDDGMARIASTTMSGTAGAGSLTFAGLTASTLADGPVAVLVEITDTIGNVTSFTATPATKDTVPPGVPLGGGVASGLQNATDVINSSSETQVVVEVSLGALSSSGDMVTATLADGVALVTTPPAVATTGVGTITLPPTSCATLADGSITIAITVTDMAGNVASAPGRNTTKDVVAPAAPVGAFVAAGMTNPQDYVNSTSQSATSVVVNLPASYSGNETVSVLLSDGMGPVVFSPVVGAPAGGGMVTIPNLVASPLADGTLTLLVDVRDAAGNICKHNATPATKDTVAPTPPSLLGVAAGPMNVADQIIAANAAAVVLDVNWDSGMDGTETTVTTFTGPLAATVTIGPISPPMGGGMGTLGPGDVTSLADGAVTLSMVLTDVAGNSTTFTGTTATKSSTAPDPPTSAGVAAGPSNALDVINLASESAIDVDVVFGPTASASNQVLVRVSDGATTVTSPPLSSPTGAGSITFAALDVSTLLDGTVTVTVEITDPSTNTTVFTGTPATKDSVAPAAPSAAAVAMTGANPTGFVNAASETNVTVDVILPASYDGSETVTVRLGDGVSPDAVGGPVGAPVGGGTVSIGGVDASLLADGALTLTVITIDAAGNTTSFGGSPATKDTTAPVAPTLLEVASGAGNSQNLVNTSNEGVVSFDLSWHASMVGNETATVTITSSGGGSAVLGPLSAPVGGGPAVVGLADVSALGDGTLTLVIDVFDPAGNAATFTGTPATKDATAPSPPSSAEVAAGGGNAVDEINQSNEGAVVIDVVFPPSADPADSIVVILSDGMTMIMSGAMSPPMGGGTLTFPGLDTSTLNEGSILISIEITDTNGNMTVFAGSPAAKDVTPPVAPTHANVALTANNPLDFINSASEGSVTVEVVLPAAYVGNETLSVTLDDGMNPTITAGPLTAPVGGGTLAFAGIDGSTLAEGTVTLQVDISDGAGNPSSFAGTSATKDVTPPVAPSALAVAAGMNNLSDVINGNNAGAVLLDVTWDVSMAGDETATVDFTSSGGGMVTSSAATAPPGGGMGALGPTDVSSIADGTVSLALTLVDPAGNSASFTGTPATKDVLGPANPTSAGVMAGMNNPVDGINSNNEGAVVIEAFFGTGSDSSDTVFVTLNDGMTSVMTTTLNAPAGMGSLLFPSVDASGLANGVVTVTVQLEDTLGNVTVFVGTPATKAGMPPDPITSANVAMTGQNPVDFINSTTEGSVTVEVVTPATYVGTEQIVVTLADGMNPPVVSSAMTSPVGMGTVTFTGLNASGLAEGAVTLTVDVTDGAGNAAMFTGTAAMKDVTPPTAPSSLAVASGAENAADLINMHNEGAVVLDVVWDASMAGDETASVEFQDGASGSVTSGTVTAPMSGGADTIGPTDVMSLADGVVMLTLTLTDPAGNATPFTGTAATKDVVGPDMPTAAFVAMGGSNAQDVINPNNEAAVVIEVTVGAGSVNTDTVIATIDDGVAMAQTGSAAAPAGAGSVVFPAIDSSTLSEGTINLSIELIDANNNSTTFSGTAALKDTIAPAAPTSARVDSGMSNPQDFINEFTEGGAEVTVVLPASYTGTEQVTVTLDDGVAAPVVSSAQGVSMGGGTLVFAGLDVSGLADGVLTLTVDVVDGGGNTGSFTGTAPTKDTVDPDVSAARVPFQPSHPEDYISRFDASSLTAEVDWGATAAGTESATLAFDDGTSTINSGSQSATVGAGTVSYAGLDVSSLDDGTVTMTVTAQDAAGNVATIAVPLTKKSSGLGFTRNVYAVNRADDTISFFLTDFSTGQLRSNGFTTTGTRPVDLVLDPLARYAYAANETSNDISVYTVSKPTGNLIAGTPVAAGTAPVAVAIDPLARFVYAVNSGSDDVSAYTVTTGTGALSGGTTIAAGTAPSDGVVGLAGDLLVVCGGTSNDLHSFTIDQTTGALTAASTLATGTEPVSVVVHPSGRFVYTANRTSDDITVATLDPSTGALGAVSTVAAGTMPTAVEVTPDGLYLYCANAGSDDVSLYSINQSTGDLTSLAAAIAAGTKPVAVRSSTAADLLFVANETSNDVMTFTIGAGTGLLTLDSTALAQGDPVDLEIGGGAGAVGFTLRFAYVGNKASDDISSHTINDGTGALTTLGSPVATGTDPISITVHPLGSWIYCINEVTDDIRTYSVNAISGALTEIGTPLSTGAGPKAIAISPSGQYLYVANGDTDDISGFAVNQTTGLLTSLGATTLTDVEPVAAVVTANGKFLYVACQGSDTVRAYSISASTGALTPVGSGVATGIIPIGVETHPSGSFVYVVNRGTGDIYLYDADVDTGALSFSASYAAGSQPFGMKVSPLGEFAYAVNRTSQDVTAYTINPATGALSQIGSPIAAGTDSRAVAIDPRTEFVYVTDFAASGPGTIYIYSINAMTGALTSIGTQAAGGSGSISLIILAEIL